MDMFLAVIRTQKFHNPFRALCIYRSTYVHQSAETC